MPGLFRSGVLISHSFFVEGIRHSRRRVVSKSFAEITGSPPRAENDQQDNAPVPCVIICRSLTPPPEFLEAAGKHDIPVYSSPMVTSKFTALAINYLNRRLAPHMTRHGVLVDVYGVGVLLSGKSGVGKSEAALELVKRGHQLVADDVVDICRISDDRLIGTCPEKIRHLMEIRGIGVIDVKALYGIGAVAQSKSIDLIIELESWDENKPFDRIGIQDPFYPFIELCNGENAGCHAYSPLSGPVSPAFLSRMKLPRIPLTKLTVSGSS